ncbi:MAG: VWA domain-containing protein [Sorangiineae bacterium PRO1]|nr:VWA domain-containing protein [Sorangiineae bacterium PRO1]
MAKQLLRALAVVVGLGVIVMGVVFAVRPKVVTRGSSVADLSVVHPSVRVDGAERRGLVRLAPGNKIETDPQGRARLRLDDGTLVLVDKSTALSVGEAKVELGSGRLFVEGVLGARAEISIGEVKVRPGAARVGFDRREGPARVYAANEEIVVVSGTTEHKVRAGESAVLEGGNVSVRAEKAFDDWTGGLAAPWGPAGPPRRAVGEVWGAEAAAKPGDPGSPLTIRSLDLQAKVQPEVAETRVTTTYFNGGSQSVRGDFRMALPPNAIVSRFAWGSDHDLAEGNIAIAARGNAALTPQGHALLEWAGEGWVRGHLPSIASGAAVTVVVEYIEWLPVRRDAGKLLAQYRFPLAAAGEPPLIGEFSAQVDASLAKPRALTASSGANVEGTSVRTRRPDFRPTADLVVDVELAPWDSNARLYLAQKSGDEDASTVLVRADLPDVGPDVGATLALVVDTSGSAEAAELDVSRAFVRAVLDALGDRDQVVVLAADQTVRPVGPKDIGPLDAARKTAILEALGKLAPGGATDLGRALEAGADALPADAPAGVVVYVGDGWATVGDPDVKSVEARLARRAGGKPRVGAVAVGPMSHVRALRALTQGSGPLLFVSDSSEATAAATELVADALRPAFAGVELVLGPEIEQVYPRSARAAFAGTTIEAVGRVRGRSPSTITLRWRDKAGAHEDSLLVALRVAPWPDDVRRRWAKARIDELLLGRRGREAVTDVALRSGLLTPWTGFAVGKVYMGTALEARQLDVALSDVISPWDDVPIGKSANDFGPGALTSVPHPGRVEDRADDKELADAVAAAAGYSIDGAMASVRACRDSRAALRPELAGTLLVSLAIDGSGRPSDVKVRGRSPEANDDALNRCVEVALAGLSYPQSGLATKVRVEREIMLPPPRAALRGTKCSSLSQLPMPLRRGVWRVRLGSEAPFDVYTSAKRQCELNGWADRRALLEIVLLVERDGVRRVQLARALETAGEVESAAFIRREAVRRARSANELVLVKQALVGTESYPMSAFQKRYRAATGDEGRLAVVRQFLTIAPHDGFLKERLIVLLEALGKKDELAEEARRVRVDPFASAEVLADVASALRRLGDEDEARRTFGELSERAPADPWARAFLGDRLRNEGLFDDASRAYAALSELAADEPASVLRSALAHAGAGRLDLARRLLTRVVETGGRSGQASASMLAGHVAAALLAEARSGAGVAKEQTDALTFASLEVPRAEKRHVLLLRTPAALPGLEVKLVRRFGKEKEEIPVDIAAAAMGLYSLAFDPQGAEVELLLTRPEELAPARAYKLRVDTLLPSDALSTPPKLTSSELELPATGKPVTLRWAEGGWVSPGTL